MIIKMPSAIDNDARRAALALLAEGVVRPHEAAELAGVSLQVMGYWIASAGIDWQRVRKRRLAKAWAKVMKGSSAGNRRHSEQCR